MKLFPLCPHCGRRHEFWLTCYSAAKMEYESGTGLEFWSGERRLSGEEIMRLRIKMGLAHDNENAR